MMAHTIIAFVGGGNMARSLIGGLIEDGWPEGHIRVADPDPRQLDILHRQYGGIVTTQQNEEAIERADVIVLAVKPQIIKSVAQTLSRALPDRNPLIISIVAGTRSSDLTRWLNGAFAVVRCMPNTPALVGSSASGLVANAQVSSDQRETAESILRAVGLTVWLSSETLMDAVTAVSGSGPAYFLRVMEAVEVAGVKLGLSKEISRLLTLQTAFGTAKLALESKEDAATLRARVTSRGGTTERAIEQLEHGNIDQLFERAITAAARRSEELAEELGKGS
jgi:pyrroline-5-carboxylate reductase